jgi:tetratricopeptide (TPR) repeat protein
VNLPSELSEAMAAFQSGDLERARQLAERSQGAGQTSAPRDHLLGLIHCRLGDVATGVEHLRRAAEAEPANVAFRLMLARALIDNGTEEEVLAMPEPPLDGKPPSVAMWQVRAEAADVAGDARQARDAWQAVAAARPSDWRAWSNLGNACAALELWEEATDALRRAVAINPAEPAIRRNLAAALGNSGLAEDAVAEFEQAVRMEPGHAPSRLTLARLLADLGRYQDSMAHLDEVSKSSAKDGFAVDPGNAEGVRELGLLLERTSRMVALRELLVAASAAGVGKGQLGYLWAASELREGRAAEARAMLLTESPAADPERWHRLMAKICDALGETDAAFAAAEAMNAAVRNADDWRARGADYRARLRALAELVRPEWTGRLPQLEPSERRAPAFLIGFPRSGTTLLDTFLMGHPETEVLEEVHMLDAALLVIGKLADLPECPPETLRRAREAYFEEFDRNVPAGFDGLVVDKLPLNMLGAPLIHSLFPDARFIFAQRHPCDAVLSGYMQSFVMNDAMACFLDIADAADLYDVAMEVWTRACRALPLEVHTLVYEQLVADPEAALRPLVDFLGLEWREELLDHRSTAKRRGAIITPSYDQVTEPLDPRPSGRWRRYADQLQPVLPVLLPWADRLGYPK